MNGIIESAIPNVTLLCFGANSSGESFIKVFLLFSDVKYDQSPNCYLCITSMNTWICLRGSKST